MPLVAQFNELVRGLVDEWTELRLELTLADPAHLERALALLAPANPGRRGSKIRFTADRLGPGIGLEAVRRLLKRLDDSRIDGELELVQVQEALPEELRTKDTLRASWDRQIALLPSDWSDLYAEVNLDSTDYVERAALLLSPVNPAGHGITTLRFRCARRFGYGASPEMTARCLERCDDGGITGTTAILHVLSDTEPVGTQGPVWILGGRTV